MADLLPHRDPVCSEHGPKDSTNFGFICRSCEREPDEQLTLAEQDVAPAASQLVSDLARSEAARDAAIKRVDDHADPAWKERALSAVRELAESRDDLTTDDVWLFLGETPREPRAMGPIIRQAANRGWIADSGTRRKATRVVNHARPQTVWRSLLRAAR